MQTQKTFFKGLNKELMVNIASYFRNIPAYDLSRTEDEIRFLNSDTLSLALSFLKEYQVSLSNINVEKYLNIKNIFDRSVKENSFTIKVNENEPTVSFLAMSYYLYAYSLLSYSERLYLQEKEANKHLLYYTGSLIAYSALENLIRAKTPYYERSLTHIIFLRKFNFQSFQNNSIYTVNLTFIPAIAAVFSEEVSKAIHDKDKLKEITPFIVEYILPLSNETTTILSKIYLEWLSTLSMALKGIDG